jgi:LuxR family transcriptional regulator, maltose regulon positive regulatory protein
MPSGCGPGLTCTLPDLAVQAGIELARVYLALTDLAGARTLLREIVVVLRRRPGPGTLASESLAAAPGPSALTAAELRLLPLLATHMPAREIAAQMVLTPHTIRTQIRSIYRRLGVDCRIQAVYGADIRLADAPGSK